jgi:adenylate cyclase
MSLLRELRRRNVHKVATVYLLCAWLAIEIVWVFFPTIESPDDFLTVVVVIVALGFVTAVWVAWKFEMTPSGMKRTENVPPNESIPYWSRRKFTALVLSVGGLALLLLLYQLLRAGIR